MAHQISSGRFSWTGRRVLVTGGAGFVGSYLVEDLLSQGADVRVVDDFSSSAPDGLPALGEVDLLSGDLRDPEIARAAVAGMDVVMHLAARAYGMLRSMENCPEILRDNCLMSFNVLDAAVEAGVERALMVSSSCVYPDDAPVPTPELPVHQKLPESVNEGYGWGKRMLEIQSRYVHEKHGLPIAIVRPFNAYGGRYRWQGMASHVVPSLVKKVLDRDGPVVVWGSGDQARDLLHARDFALGFRLATECAVDCDPINLGCGTSVRLVEIVEKVADLAGVEVEVEFDHSKPDGRRCKQADISKLRRRCPAFRQTVSLEQGLAEMIEWYERTRHAGVFDDSPSLTFSPLPAPAPAFSQDLAHVPDRGSTQMSARLGWSGIERRRRGDRRGSAERRGHGDRRGVTQLRQSIDGADSAKIIRPDPDRAQVLRQ